MGTFLRTVAPQDVTLDSFHRIVITGSRKKTLSVTTTANRCAQLKEEHFVELDLPVSSQRPSVAKPVIVMPVDLPPIVKNPLTSLAVFNQLCSTKYLDDPISWKLKCVISPYWFGNLQ